MPRQCKVQQLLNVHLSTLQESFNVLYKAYIRPHIQYCVQAWSPYYAKDMHNIVLENMQHRTTKLIPTMHPKFKHVCRRKCVDLIETFKILKQHLLIDFTKLLTLSPINFTKGHNFKFSIQTLSYSCKSKFYMDRIII